MLIHKEDGKNEQGNGHRKEKVMVGWMGIGEKVMEGRVQVQDAGQVTYSSSFTDRPAGW